MNDSWDPNEDLSNPQAKILPLLCVVYGFFFNTGRELRDDLRQPSYFSEVETENQRGQGPRLGTQQSQLCNGVLSTPQTEANRV